MATHTEEQLDRALDIMASVGRQLGLIPEAEPIGQASAG
jgi:hypothetical protein